MFRICVRRLATEAEAVSNGRGNVKIPAAIPRSSTSLLSAISSTVGVDQTAPHFAFIDDPTTIPTTPNNMRNYYMAKEMGKRSARQLAEEWPTLFAFDRDVPYLTAFRPEKNPDPAQVDPTEENLLKMLDSLCINDAIQLYEIIRSKDIEVSKEAQMRMLQACAYYNCVDPPSSESEDWPGLRTFGEDAPKQWVQANLADLLYEVLPKTIEVKSIMVAALCKYRTSASLQTARTIFKEMLNDKQAPTVEAFNGLLRETEYKETKDLLSKMNTAGVLPNVHTFESLLFSAGKSRKVADRVKAFREVFGEMQAATISPSLACANSVLSAFIIRESEQEQSKHKSHDDTTQLLAITWLAEFMDHFERVPGLEAQSIDDTAFFTTAMRLCYNCANVEMADRVLSLYEAPTNSVKLPALSAQNIFYNRYLLMFVEKSVNVDEIEKVYKSFVPRLVGVTRTLTQVVCNKLAAVPHWPLLFRVIEDGICARQMADIRVSQTFRQLLIKTDYGALSPAEREQYSRLVVRLVDIWTEFSRFTEEYARRMQIKMSASSLTECALLLLRAGEEDRAYALLDVLLDPQQSQGENATVMASGHGRYTAVMELFEHALRNKDTLKAATCLQVLSLQLPQNKLEPLAERILQRCPVTTHQASIIHGFVRLRPQ